MDAKTRKLWAARAGGVAALALAALAVWLLVRPVLEAPAPRAEDWAAAAELIREDLVQGDMIRVEPFWSTGGRIWFGDLDGGPAKAFRLLDVHEPADPYWLTRAPRVWIVAAMGYGDTVITNLQALGYSLAADEDLGRIRLVRMDRGVNGLLWELVAEYRAAEVISIKRSKIRRTTQRVAGGPRDCLTLGGLSGEGPPGGRLRWEEIPGEGVLRIRAGNTKDAARKRLGGNVTITARAGGEEASLVITAGSYTLEALELPFEGGGLDIEVRSDADSLQQLCLDGLLIGPVSD